MTDPQPNNAISLPAPRTDSDVSVEQALQQRRTSRTYAQGEPLALQDLAQLLWAAQGTTNSPGFRTAPSAGALYPLEVHVVVANVDGLSEGLFRYAPEAHRLDQYDGGDKREALVAAAWDQDWIAEAPAILVITGVEARTAEKYGDRSTRYMFMEAGHAAQNVLLQAQTLSLDVGLAGAFTDSVLARLLKLPDGEAPLYILPTGKPRR